MNARGAGARVCPMAESHHLNVPFLLSLLAGLLSTPYLRLILQRTLRQAPTAALLFHIYEFISSQVFLRLKMIQTRVGMLPTFLLFSFPKIKKKKSLAGSGGKYITFLNT